MTQEELNYIKDSFSQILDDIGGNPDWYNAAKAVASDLGTIEKELEERVTKFPSDLDEAAEEYGRKEYSHAMHFWDEGFSKNKPEVMKEDFVDSFKAGAEWMAGQGYEQAEKDLGWISVKDGLPKEGHFVLTCVADTGTPQCVGMALLLKDGTWWDGDIKVRVDYWMEVPKLKK